MKNFRLKGSPSGWGTYPYMFPDRTSSPAFGRPACWTDKNGIPILQAHQGSNPLGAPCGLGLAAARARARFVRVRALGVRPKEAERFYLKCDFCASITVGLAYSMQVYFAKGAVLLAQNVFLPYLWRVLFEIGISVNTIRIM